MSAPILPLFGKLASADATERLDASTQLVGSVSHEVDSTAAEDDEDLQYSLKRLIRGLASSRESARLGFSVALTELLQRSNTVSPTLVLELLFGFAAIPANVKPAEERDLLFARLFGISALFRSGIVFRSPPADEADDGSDEGLQAWTEATTELGQLLQKKAWLRESVGWVLLEAVRDLLAANGSGSISAKGKGKGKGKAAVSGGLSWFEPAVRGLLERFFARNKIWSLEKLALAIVLQEAGVDADWSNLLAPTFPSAEILSPQNTSVLIDLVKGYHQATDGKPGIPAATPDTGRPHFVYAILANAVASESEGKLKIAEFSSRLLDNYFFAKSTATTARRQQGLVILRTFLESALPGTDKVSLLTPTVVATLQAQLSGRDRALHKAATTVTGSIVAAAKGDSALARAFAERIRNAEFAFDQRSRTRTVEALIGSADAEGIVKWTSDLVDVVLGGMLPWGSSTARTNGESASFSAEESDEEVDEDPVRLTALDQLAGLIRTGAASRAGASGVVLPILRTLIVAGWFEGSPTPPGKKSKSKGSANPTRVPDPALRPAFRELCRTRFYSCLADLASQTEAIAGGDKGKARVQGVDKDSVPWVTSAYELFWDLRKHKELSLVVEEDEEMEPLRQDGVRAHEIISKATGSQARSLKVLCEAMLLASVDEASDIGPLFEILEACAPELLAPADPTTAGGEVVDGEGDLVQPMSALVELFLELLSRPIAFLRTITDQTFSSFTNRLDRQSLQLILDPIMPTDSKAADGEPIEEDEVAESGDDQDEQESEDEEERSDSDLSDEEGDVEVDQAFRDEIAAALGLDLNNINEAEDVDDDEAEESEDEVLLDDEQMMALDDNLAEIFRRRTAKANSKEVRTDELHVRMRLLDLLPILVKNEPASPLLPLLLLPLLHTARRADNEQAELRAKAVRIVNILCAGGAKILPSIEDADEVFDILRLVHGIARNAHASDISNLCGKSSVWLVQALEAGSPKEAVAVGAIYVATLEDYASRKHSSVQPAFFQEFIKRCPKHAWGTKDAFLAAATEEATVNLHRRIQIFLLLQALVTAQAALKTDAAKASIVTFMPSFGSAIFSVIGDNLKQDPLIGSDRLKELLKIAIAAARLTRRCTIVPAAVSAAWPAQGVSDLESAILGSEKFEKANAVKGLLKQLVEATKVETANGDTGKAKGKKRKEQDGISKVEVNGREKKKAKKAGRA